MMFDLEQALAVLERTPRVLHTLLDGLSDVWTRSNYGDATYSPFDVVGHLIEADQTNWLPRLQHILASGNKQPFAAFDRDAMFERNKNRSLSTLLEEFVALRGYQLSVVRAMQLTPTQLALCGQHPELGVVTVAQLLATWVVHDLNHTHQIAKAMAYQYRDAVGPWRSYLSILPKD